MIVQQKGYGNAKYRSPERAGAGTPIGFGHGKLARFSWFASVVGARPSLNVGGEPIRFADDSSSDVKNRLAWLAVVPELFRAFDAVVHLFDLRLD